MPPTKTFDTFLQQVDYSLMDSLNADPEATADGRDHWPREVLSGHYVPVTPTPIPNPEYRPQNPCTHGMHVPNEEAQEPRASLQVHGNRRGTNRRR